MRILIEITLGEIINLTPALKTLMEKSFKGNIAFKISRLARELNKETILFEEEQNKILQRYAEKDEEGNIVYSSDKYIKVSSPNDYNEEINKLLKTKVEINAGKIPSEFLEAIEISPADLMLLDCIIE